jgi:hypothetical protein
MAHAEHGPSGIDSLFFWKHEGFIKGVINTLKLAGIGAVAMTIAPPILACAKVATVTPAFVGGSIVTVAGIQAAEKLKKSKKSEGGGHNAGHH